MAARQLSEAGARELVGAEARLFPGVEDGLLLVAEARQLSEAVAGDLMGAEARLFPGLEDGLLLVAEAWELVGEETGQLSEMEAGLLLVLMEAENLSEAGAGLFSEAGTGTGTGPLLGVTRVA